jgi:putative restriction endonuclease
MVASYNHISEDSSSRHIIAIVEDDDLLRVAAFLSLDALRARHGDALPLRDGLAGGFVFDGRRIPFLNPQKGIHRAAAQRGAAALSILTSFRSPYGDQDTVEGFVYAYRSGPVDQPDNRALRAAFYEQVPLIHFVAVLPGVYTAVYPCFITADDPHAGQVIVTPGVLRGTSAELPEDPIDRGYVVRETRIRLHQGRFRALVLPAYRERCTICRLKELRLLDAAHIVPDSDPAGAAAVTNGLSLCSIHHRAFDQDLVGISPDYVVKIAPRLLDEEDGPMLDLLKGFHDRPIEIPRNAARRPDRDRLALRFDRFQAA